MAAIGESKMYVIVQLLLINCGYSVGTVSKRLRQVRPGFLDLSQVCYLSIYLTNLSLSPYVLYTQRSHSTAAVKSLLCTTFVFLHLIKLRQYRSNQMCEFRRHAGIVKPQES